MNRTKMLALVTASVILFAGCSSIFSGDTRVILPDQELVLPSAGFDYVDKSQKDKFTLLGADTPAAFWWDNAYDATAPVAFMLVDYVPEENSFVYAYQLLEKVPEPAKNEKKAEPTKMITSLIKYNYVTKEPTLIFSQVTPPNGEQTAFAEKITVYKDDGKVNYNAYFIYFNGYAYYYKTNGSCYRSVDLMTDYISLLNNRYPNHVKETVVDVIAEGNNISLRAMVENKAIDENYDPPDGEENQDNATTKDVKVTYMLFFLPDMFLTIEDSLVFLSAGEEKMPLYKAKGTPPKDFRGRLKRSDLQEGRFFDAKFLQQHTDSQNISFQLDMRFCGFVDKILDEDKDGVEEKATLHPAYFFCMITYIESGSYDANTPMGPANYSSNMVRFSKEVGSRRYSSEVTDVGAIDSIWTAVFTKDDIELLHLTYPSNNIRAIPIPRTALAVFDKELEDMQKKTDIPPEVAGRQNEKANSKVNGKLGEADKGYDPTKAEDQINNGEVGNIEEYVPGSITVNSEKDILFVGPANGILRYDSINKTTKQLQNIPLYRLWQDADGNYTSIGFIDSSKSYSTQDILMSRVIRLALE